MENNHQLWHETRNLQPRFKQPVEGIINLVLVTLFFWVLWWVFMDPRGILRWYTPMYGYMYIRWILIVAIWQVYIFNYWPLKEKFLVNTHPLLKGLILIAMNFVIVFVVIWGFYYNLIGRFAIPYFSAKSLEATGLSFFFAREYSSLAILMMAAIASWLAPIWPALFDNYPWQGLKRAAKGTTVLIVSFFFTTYLFLIFMHPHYHVLFYPWQQFTAAFPWWYKFAGTLHGNFNVGWIMCATIAVWLVELPLERYPFKLIKTQPLRGIVGFLGVIVIAIIMFATFNFLQEVAWGPAVEGGKRLMAPDWRYLHSGELACMLLVSAAILAFYFNNWPNKFNPAVNIAIRLLIILVTTAVFHQIYYKFSPPILGTQPGYSHPQQFPMAPVIMWITCMLYHNWFMDLFPGRKLVADPNNLKGLD